MWGSTWIMVLSLVTPWSPKQPINQSTVSFKMRDCGWMFCYSVRECTMCRSQSWYKGLQNPTLRPHLHVILLVIWQRKLSVLTTSCHMIGWLMNAKWRGFGRKWLLPKWGTILALHKRTGKPWKPSVRMATGPGYGSDRAQYEYKGWILPLHQPKSCTGYTQDIMKRIPSPPCSEHTTLHCVSASRVQPSGKQSTVRLNNHRHEWTRCGDLLDQCPCIPSNINILNLNT